MAWLSVVTKAFQFSVFFVYILLLISLFSIWSLVMVSCECGRGVLCLSELRCLMRRAIFGVKLGL